MQPLSLAMLACPNRVRSESCLGFQAGLLRRCFDVRAYVCLCVPCVLTSVPMFVCFWLLCVDIRAHVYAFCDVHRTSSRSSSCWRSLWCLAGTTCSPRAQWGPTQQRSGAHMRGSAEQSYVLSLPVCFVTWAGGHITSLELHIGTNP